MRLFDRFWSTVTVVINWLTFLPVDKSGIEQRPLFGNVDLGQDAYHSIDSSSGADLAPFVKGPVFKPPTVGPDSTFTCDYSNMPGWAPCSSTADRGCWLRNTADGRQFNIYTDYESNGPVGVTRSYTLLLNDGQVNADGVSFTAAKLFNNTYPGPWIQACWGDKVIIKVINNLKYNGTSIHWHGIRQLGTTHMDGVNGVSQCPIAPGDSFTYIWNATQYGSTWYHSHYSAQYADGLQAPITIHGPSSAPFDESKYPLIMTDWGHNSAFSAEYIGLRNPSILLNGRGNVTRYLGPPAPKGTGPIPDSVIPDPYALNFQPKAQTGLGRAKRYLLRLINTSFDSVFVFTIDNHVIQILTADFVPIQPYYTYSILVGIGQRYNVIVEANPQGGSANPPPADGNFWIRTWLADGCPINRPGDPNPARVPVPSYERAGILRYDMTSALIPKSSPWPANLVPLRCSDEPYEKLIPIVPWTIGEDDNGLEQFNVTFGGGLPPQNGRPGVPGRPVPGFPLAQFSFEPTKSFTFRPLQVDYANPTLLHLNKFPIDLPASYVLIPETLRDWVYIVIAGSKPTFGPPGPPGPPRPPNHLLEPRQPGPPTLTFGAHPIHLHGHDFVLLQQEDNTPFSLDKLNLKLNNPPRRDVVLLPIDGFVVLAFKADNPGPWLLHCHIARHASGGLALQILKRQADANKALPANSAAIVEANRVCANWKTWFTNCKNWWRGCDPHYAFQDDSGI